MMLPGGIWNNESLQCQFHFKPITGEVELALAESRRTTSKLPQQVSAVLASALDSLGNKSPTYEGVARLSVGDRQYLIRQLGIHLGQDSIWLTAQCHQCAAHFDVSIRQSQLPVKPAGAAYPFVEIYSAIGCLKFRVPNGDDQEVVASLEDERQACTTLLRRCLIEPRDIDLTALTDSDVQFIETAMESVAPEVANQIQATCPECDTENLIEISPYSCLDAAGKNLFTEIHQLAMHYHWSEAEILAMPRSRRSTYLSLIDRARGMVT